MVGIAAALKHKEALTSHKASEGSDGAGKGSLFAKKGYMQGRAAPVAGAIRVQSRRLESKDGTPLLTTEKTKDGQVVVVGGQEQWETTLTVGFNVVAPGAPDDGKVTYARIRLDGEENVPGEGGERVWVPRLFRLFDLVEAVVGVKPNEGVHAAFKANTIKVLENASPKIEAAGDLEKRKAIYAKIDETIAGFLRNLLQPGGQAKATDFPLVNLCVSGTAYPSEKLDAEKLKQPDEKLIPLVKATSTVTYTPSHAHYAKKTAPGSSPLSDQAPLEKLAVDFLVRQRKELTRRAQRAGGITAPSGDSTPPANVIAAQATTGVDEDLFG